MDMDKTTDIETRLAFAKALYLGLSGEDIDAKTRAKAIKYSENLFVTPWKDQSDSLTQAYSQRFFGSLADMGESTSMMERWRPWFDSQGEARDPEQARLFISDFFRVQLHYPRTYHNFVCQGREVTARGVLDFPIEHPISVEFWGVYLTTAGAATLHSENGQTRLHANDLLIVPPGCICSLERAADSSHWHYHWLSFRSQLSWIELLQWATEITRPTLLQLEPGQSLEALGQQFEQLESTTYQPGTLSERLCTNIIENTLIRLRLLADASGREKRTRHRTVEKAVDFILSHYSEDLSLEEVAAAVSISPSRLRALFREHFGISVIRWRDQLRMQKARELLQHTEHSVKQVAALVGYPDALYFSRRFRGFCGVSPSEYRAHQATTGGL